MGFVIVLSAQDHCYWDNNGADDGDHDQRNQQNFCLGTDFWFRLILLVFIISIIASVVVESSMTLQGALMILRCKILGTSVLLHMLFKNYKGNQKMFALKWNDSYNFPKMEVKTMLLRVHEVKANYVANFSNLPILVQMYFWSTVIYMVYLQPNDPQWC